MYIVYQKVHKMYCDRLRKILRISNNKRKSNCENEKREKNGKTKNKERRKFRKKMTNGGKTRSLCENKQHF